MNTVPKHKEDLNPFLKLVLELGPLVVFFFANARGKQLAETYPTLADLGGPLFIATAAFMIAITLSLSVSYALTRTLPVMPMVSCIIVLVMGGMTLYLQNETFIKMKPTIVNTLFGTLLLGGMFFGKSLLSYVFGDAFKLSEEGWRKLTLRWGLFFLFLAVANEFVWRLYSTDTWVNFKVFAIMPITLIFTASQMPLIIKHTVEEEKSPAE